MTTNKRSKSSRRRGHTTHGWGSMKKRRGAGHRGGRGRAGTGKRGDAKKPVEWKARRKQGKFGFKSKSRAVKQKTINLKTMDDMIEKLVANGLAKVQNGSYYVNLEDIGYNKLLGAGKITKKYMITTPLAVPKAIEKVKAAGGNVTVTLSKGEDVQEPVDENPAEEGAGSEAPAESSAEPE